MPSARKTSAPSTPSATTTRTTPKTPAKKMARTSIPRQSVKKDTIVDPAKVAARGMTASDVVAALREAGLHYISALTDPPASWIRSRFTW